MAAPADSFSGGPTAVRLPRSPPLKVLAEQLRRDAEGGPGAWRLSRAAAGRGPLELAVVAVVWMQGTVVMADHGETRLRDPSRAFSVRGLERVLRGPPCLIPGKYVMVMGVVQACSPEPCLHAVRLTDLSDNTIHESMWELEVEDLHRNIPWMMLELSLKTAKILERFRSL
ncbi:RecQ-mediated genome instability protein 2 [Saguinus oedipus]|uniref:RecQ-mediated genome instability protein 2 n=1 Tax=Saguinus oedipus TaxID=9490 RepID=A0ABQ9VNS2_SAGOE|nr:RecQ-mediated genome instability protein 2 [Saguinus oedipus]